MRIETLMVDPSEEQTPMTLGELEDQVARLLGPLDVPRDTPLARWYNASYLRQELVFQVATPIETASDRVLLDSVQRKLGAEFKDGDARAELERRLLGVV